MLKSGPTGRRGYGWTTVPFILLVIVIVLHLVPIWIFPYFPTADGPNHLNIAQILLRYDDPGYSFYREYFQLNDRPVPNLMAHYLLSGLMRFLPPLLAEKTLLTLYVVALPLGVLYVMNALSESPRWKTLLVTPFIFSFPLFMGFYNYSLGIALFFWGLGYWFRISDRMSPGSALILSAIVLITAFTHVFAAANLILVVAVTGGWRLLTGFTGESGSGQQSGEGGPDGPTASRRTLRLAVFVGLALLPTLIFLEPNISRLGIPLASDFAPVYRSIQLGKLSAVVSLSPWEYLFSIPLVLILGVLFLVSVHERRKRSGLEPADGTLLAFFGYVALFYLVADKWFLLDRLMPFLFFALILWLGTQTMNRRLLKWSAVGITALTVGMVVLRVPKLAELNGYVAEYVSAAEMVTPGSTLLGLRIMRVRYEHEGIHGPRIEPTRQASAWTQRGKLPGFRIEPTRHASAYISVRRNAVELTNYQAGTGWFPVVYRPERNPYEHIIAPNSDSEKVPPDVEFLHYPERTEGTVDYVLIWGPLNTVSDDPRVASILEQLRSGYDLIAVSERRGLMRLYRRRDFRSTSRTPR